MTAAAAPAAPEPTSGGRVGPAIAVTVLVLIVALGIGIGAWALSGGDETPGGDPTDTVARCWNGSEPDSDDGCPPFSGEEALVWAFPVDVVAGNDDELATCDIDGRIWECEWDDLASTYFEVENSSGTDLSEDTITDDVRIRHGGSAEASVSQPQLLTIGEVRIGQRWDVDVRLSGLPAVKMAYYEYDDIPFRAVLITESDSRSLTTSEQSDHTQAVTRRIVMRSPGEIELARTGAAR